MSKRSSRIRHNLNRLNRLNRRLRFVSGTLQSILVIGGHAVAFHGYPRATADLDVWVAMKQKNALRLVAALKEFGFDVPELTPGLFLSHNRIIRMGVAPNRIEIQTGMDGVEFTACYPADVLAEGGDL